MTSCLLDWWEKNFATCEVGERRLNERARVEALTTVENEVSKSTRVIHVFDREGDITEVFDKVRQLQSP